MPLSKIPVGADPPREINVIIENPLGGDPVKYELDKASGAMFVDRFLHTAMYYPGNYGFTPHTLSGDGDPIDVLVVGRVPVMPGAVMRSRPVGVLVMEDEAGEDEKILAVPIDQAAPLFHRRGRAIRTCRRSCWIRSAISSPITRIWRRENGPASCAGAVLRKPAP